MVSERDIIYITKKQASVAVVALSAFCLLVFMVGYSWGKQSVLDELGQRITQSSIEDGADYESIINPFTDELSMEALSPESLEADDSEGIRGVKSLFSRETDSSLRAHENADKIESPQPEKQDAKKYSATLIGFGTKGAAQSFVGRLGKHGITVHMKTRVSKSASGKIKRNWYQIVTNSYNSKEELQSLIAQIQKIERLKSSDIKIN